VGVLIIVLGVVGLLAAVVAFGELSWDAVRRHHYLDIVVALAVGVLVVWLLIAYGGSILQ
jgi:uncharacterized membrane protein YidH (DUF202 family)